MDAEICLIKDSYSDDEVKQILEETIIAITNNKYSRVIIRRI